MNDPIGDDLKIRGLAGTRAAEAANAAEAASAAEAVDGTAATEAAAASAPIAATETAAIGDPAAIAQALASGAIDAENARSQLITAVTASQLPPGASPAEAAALHAEIEALLVGNPVLDALLRPT